MAKKEIVQEEKFDALKQADTSNNAKLHGVIATVSPMKKGKSADFFEAKITDGDTEMRVVGFQGSQRND